jgi:hypothetical protein
VIKPSPNFLLRELRRRKVFHTTAVPRDDSRSDTDVLDGDAEADDLYSNILKLDDLRQRGLITDEEYEQEKKELLEAN